MIYGHWHDRGNDQTTRTSQSRSRAKRVVFPPRVRAHGHLNSTSNLLENLGVSHCPSSDHDHGHDAQETCSLAHELTFILKYQFAVLRRHLRVLNGVHVQYGVYQRAIGSTWFYPIAWTLLGRDLKR